MLTSTASDPSQAPNVPAEFWIGVRPKGGVTQSVPPLNGSAAGPVTPKKRQAVL